MRKPIVEALKGKAEPDRINIIDIASDWRKLGKDILHDPAKTNDVKDFARVGKIEQKLRHFLSGVDLQDLENQVTELGTMEFLHTLKKCPYVEHDWLFEWDAKYILVFSYFLSEHQKFPSFQEFWELWRQMNDGAYTYNLSLQRSPYQNSHTNMNTSALVYMLDRERSLSEAEAREWLMNGAELRAKRFVGAAIRELHASLILTKPFQDDFDEWHDPCEVWMHPLIDCTCKYDSVIITPNEKAAGVSICLKSEDSQKMEEKKGDKVPAYFKEELDFGIGLHVSPKLCDGVFLLNRSELSKMRLALNGEPTRIRALNSEYSWTS